MEAQITTDDIEKLLLSETFLVEIMLTEDASTLSEKIKLLPKLKNDNKLKSEDAKICNFLITYKCQGQCMKMTGTISQVMAALLELMENFEYKLIINKI